jgi:MFS transporter, PAT family, beta-lactamase induction signal transducer AmpG
MTHTEPTSRSPWYFIPTLYFQQGVPVIIVQQVSVILYKKMGLPNDQIGLWTSLIAWPWILKMLWGPLVDLNGKKRNWVLAMQLCITLSLAAIALAVTSSAFLPVTLGIFLITAFFSATHDIALDGYYLLALPKDKQAFFIGIRTTAFRLAMIFGTGGLVMLAGYLEKSGVQISRSWRDALLLAAIIYGAFMIYAHWLMPKVTKDQPIKASEPAKKTAQQPSFSEAIKSFFAQPKIGTILLFILLYRFGESMLSKMSGLFLLDSKHIGGMGLETIQVGMILGNVGMISLVIGGLLGGFAIARFGLRKCIWPMVLSMNVPNLLYVWAAYTQPSAKAAYALIAVDQFGYGFGLASYMVYIMYLCQRSKFQTSHYAIATGLIALGAMLAGITSGYLQQHLGYFWFFCAVCGFTIPGMILLQLIPLDVDKLSDKSNVMGDNNLEAIPVGAD